VIQVSKRGAATHDHGPDGQARGAHTGHRHVAHEHRTSPADGEGATTRRASRNPFKWLLIAPILLYQRLLSPLLGQRCRFYPSCSSYAVQAIDQFGILRGLTLGTWRVLRCHPFNAGGVDLVEDQRLFPLFSHPTRAARR
jgi:putative membrane protein insertion efficiency factor